MLPIKVEMSDVAIQAEIGQRVKAERLIQNLTQAELAKRSGVSRKTVTNVENGGGCSIGSLIALLRALDRLATLDSFLPSAGPSPIELAKLKGKQRQRASGQRAKRQGEKGQRASAKPSRAKAATKQSTKQSSTGGTGNTDTDTDWEWAE